MIGKNAEREGGKKREGERKNQKGRQREIFHSKWTYKPKFKNTAR